jgi:hypothetical protein
MIETFKLTVRVGMKWERMDNGTLFWKSKRKSEKLQTKISDLLNDDEKIRKIIFVGQKDILQH